MAGNNSRSTNRKPDFMQWVTHGIKRGRFEMSARGVFYLSTLVAVVALVAVLYLTLVSQTAACGRHIEQLRTELLQLERENEQLETQVAAAGSISRLWGRAIELGFVPAEQIEYISISD